MARPDEPAAARRGAGRARAAARRLRGAAGEDREDLARALPRARRTSAAASPRCSSPTGDIVVNDGFYAAASRTSTSSSTASRAPPVRCPGFDGNGQYLRLQHRRWPDARAARRTPSTDPPGTRRCSATRSRRRSAPSRRCRPPASRRSSSNVPCHKNAVPNVNGAGRRVRGPGSDAMRKAIKDRFGDVVAIVALLVFALGVTLSSSRASSSRTRPGCRSSATTPSRSRASSSRRRRSPPARARR